MFQTKSKVLSNIHLVEDYWRVTLEAPEIASEIKPGQFIHLKLSETNFPLLRRPFSVFRCVKPGKGSAGIEVVYEVVGIGTRLMTELSEGDKLDIIGPLGQGFKWQSDVKEHVLLAGGVGAADLFMLGEEISKVTGEYGLTLNILLGATTKERLVLEDEFRTLKGQVLLSTDDGSRGYRRSVVEMLKDAIDTGKISPRCSIYACGPELMYQALNSLCSEYDIPAQVSMERDMLCGIGACLTCVCKVDRNNVMKYRDLPSSYVQFSSEAEYGYALVCKDGPVFNIKEVILDGR